MRHKLAIEEESGAGAKSAHKAFHLMDFLTLLAGFALVCLSLILAERYSIGETARLDLLGARAPGEALRKADGGFALRYEHPNGGIFRKSYPGGFGLQRIAGVRSEIVVAYDPAKPERFQPAGVSYLPGGAALTLFAGAMALVLRVRRRVIHRGQTAPAALKNK